MSTNSARVNRAHRLVVLLPFAVMALLSPPTMAGTCMLNATQGFFLAIENGGGRAFSIDLSAYQNTTGSTVGDASYNNSYGAYLLNSLPPPLFPGLITLAQTSGFADSNSPGATATSSCANATQVGVYLPAPATLLFSTTYSITGTVQPTSSSQSAAIFGDVYVYLNGTAVYSNSATTGSFATGVPTSLDFTGSSSLIAVGLHAGLNLFTIEPYAYESIATASSPPPPPPSSTPEPSSIVMMVIGSIALVGWFLIRRYRELLGASLTASLSVSAHKSGSC